MNSQSITERLDMVFASDDWIDVCAASLHESERAEHPSRAMQAWDLAGAGARADARYRAIAAHMRSIPSVKAVLVEVLAQTLATLDGYVWPSCEIRAPQLLPEAEYRAIVAQRRQGYRHKAREVITAHNKYLDLDAFAQPEEQREAILARARQQQLADVHAVQEWRQSIGAPKTLPTIAPAEPIDSRHPDGAILGDGRF